MSVAERSKQSNGLYLFEFVKMAPKNVTAPATMPVARRAPLPTTGVTVNNLNMSAITGTGFVDYFSLFGTSSLGLVKRYPRRTRPRLGPVVSLLTQKRLSFGLLFERMLNLERVSPPDFDVDFCMRCRTVVNYTQ